MLAITGPIYCDDEDVNQPEHRPDPPMELVTTDMRNNGSSWGSSTEDSVVPYRASMSK